jgi:FkbM family methyltransferase
MTFLHRQVARLGYTTISRGWASPLVEPMSRFLDYAYLRHFLDLFAIDCVLDVGANVGGYARLLRRIGYRGRIVSFEPNPSAFATLFADFRTDPLWSGFPVALGSAAASADFHIATSDNESSFLDRPQSDWIARVERVEVVRLDSMFGSIIQPLGQPTVLLKMDTQGYDLEVIGGAAGCLKQILALQSEVSVQPLYENMPHYTKALATYESLGFSLLNLSPVLRGKKHGNIIEYDAIMARLSDDRT